MKQKETIRSLWTPTAGMLSGARRVAMLLLATLLFIMTAQTALAETVNVSYLDASGASQSHDATPVAGRSLGDYNSVTWYVVNSDVELTSALGIEGNVHLILADNTTLSVNAYDYGIYMYDNSSLTIYSQSLGSDMGKLEINSEFPIRIDANSLTINGGDILSVTTNNNAVYLAAGGSMTINNGTVSLTGLEYGVFNENGSLTINGGTVTITAQTPIYNVNNYTKTGGTVTLNVSYKVIFDANGGSDVSAALVVSGGTVSKPEDPTRDGYVFVGWYNGANEYDFTAAVTTDLTLTAHWRKLLTHSDISATVPDQTLEGPNNLFENIFYKFDYVNTSDGRSYVTEMGVIVKDGDKTLTLGTDYVFGTVAGKTGNEASQVGDEYTVQIVGQGDYAGTTTATFKIKNPGGAWGNLTWSLASGTLTISGKGTMNTATTYNGYGFPWVNYRSQINFVVIVEGITSIADKAFGETHNQEKYENVTAITLPSTLTSIGANAFKGCVGATDVYCFADPANLTWEDTGDDFKPATDPKDKTKCHVADGSDWSGFSNVNVTFVDDLADVCIPYIDANGTTAYCTDYTEINTSNMPTTLDAGWYVVNDDVNYTGTITLNGDVNLILADGCTMNIGTATDRIASGNSIYAGKEYSLTIYGQALQTGTLNAFNSDKQTVYLKNYIQHGGNVTIDATNDDAIRLYGNDLTLTRGTLNVNTSANEVAISFYNTSTSFVTVSGGNLTATSNYSSIYGNLNMSGGTLTATGYLNGNVTFTGGTATIDGSIWSNATLGWTNASDYITATSYYGTVTIADSKSLSDGTTIYNSGALNDDQKAAIAGKTLQPAVKITLPTGVTATGTGVINQTDETYALSGTTATIAAATGYIISNVNTTGADLTDNCDDTYTFTVGTTDVTVTATVITYIVTQSNFYSFFDVNGYLLDAINFNKLIFQGEFANLVDYILLDRSITITGDNAVLNNIALRITGDDVTVTGFTLNEDDADFTDTDTGNDGAAIYVSGSDVTLDNLSVTYNAPSEVEAKAIFANGAENFALTNSEIIFTGADPGENHYRALEVNNSNAAIIDNNTITATFPAVPVDWYGSGIAQDLVLAVGIQGGDDVEFTNNRVTVNTNGGIDSYPTIDAVMVHSAEDILIEGNDITHLDNTTEDGPRYYYSLDIYSTTGTVEANNINVNTIGTGTAGIDRAGTAYPIQLTGPFTVTVKDNNITAISKGPIAGIYATNWQGAADLTVENNTIDITGYATTSNYALVAGIEAEIDVLKASNNTITVANGADYDDADANQVIGVGIGTSWFYGDTSADIKDNNMTVDGKYAVYYAKAVNTNVTGNNLIAHELKGNDAVYIADGSGNTVENNVPATLFAAGSTNQWMTWCGTKELVTPENVTVYTVSGIDNNSITLNDITTTASVGTQTMKVIPAYTPVLIYRETVGNDALYGMLNAPGIVPGSGYDSATGIVTSSTTGCTFYGTTKDISNIPTANYTADRTYVLHGERFLLCKDNAGIGANKCWLVLNAPNGSRQLSIGIGSDDNTTGMEDVRWQTEEGSGAWYSLDGRQLNGQPTRKGLYIYKGKKVVIK